MVVGGLSKSEWKSVDIYDVCGDRLSKTIIYGSSVDIIPFVSLHIWKYGTKRIVHKNPCVLMCGNSLLK